VLVGVAVMRDAYMTKGAPAQVLCEIAVLTMIAVNIVANPA
jgi:hypothetical protein